MQVVLKYESRVRVYREKLDPLQNVRQKVAAFIADF